MGYLCFIKIQLLLTRADVYSMRQDFSVYITANEYTEQHGSGQWEGNQLFVNQYSSLIRNTKEHLPFGVRFRAVSAGTPWLQ